METSICQYALAGRNPLPDREAWQAMVHRVAKSQTLPKWPCTQRRKTFFACGSSAPVRVKHEGGAAAGVAGTLEARVCRDTDRLCHRSHGPVRVFSPASCSWWSEGLRGQSFPVALPVQALKRASLPGVLLCCSAHQAHRGAPRLGSYSVVWCISHLKEHPGSGPTLEFRPSGVWWAGFSVFLHGHFPPQFTPSHPLDPSLCSQQQPSPWDCTTIPKFQLPATALSRVYMTVARTVWFSFGSGCHRPAVSLSALSVSPLTRTIAPCGDQTPASVAPPTEGRASPTNTPIFPLSSFILPSFKSVGLYILFSWSSTPVCSERMLCMQFCVWGIFLMSVLLSYCCCNKLPKSYWLETTQVCYLLVLLDEHLIQSLLAKIKVFSELCCLLEALGENLFTWLF